MIGFRRGAPRYWA